MSIEQVTEDQTERAKSPLVTKAGNKLCPTCKGKLPKDFENGNCPSCAEVLFS